MKAMMKIGALAALAVVLLGGCYLTMDDGVGAVGIELPESRGVSGTDDAPYARVYVIKGPTLVEVGDGTAYAEIEFDTEDDEETTEYSVGPVPAGENYEVVLVFGDYEPGNDDADVFVPTSYAVSEPFTVYAGQATPTDVLAAGETPFSPVDETNTLGRSLVGIVWDGSNLYTATSGTLYRAIRTGPGDFGGTVTFDESFTPPADRTINSISRGASVQLRGPTVWLNTTQGVLPFENGTFDDDFDAGSGVDELSILDSGAFFVDPIGPAPLAVYGYLQFDGGLSGVRDRGAPSSPEWLEPIDLSEIVSGQPIYDLMVFNGPISVDAFLATKLGAFRMPQDVLDPANNVDTAQEVFDYSDFFEVSIDEVNARITALAVGDATDPFLYLGTPRGSVHVPNILEIGAHDDPEISGSVIPDTDNLVIQDIAFGGSYVAILTNHFLVYSSNGGPPFDRVPVYASPAGEVTGMLLDPTNGVVLLSGSQGLAGIDLDS
ncbi:MAG: hypothetical protein ACOCY8_03950 [Spirochaetota bacterium]